MPVKFYLHPKTNKHGEAPITVSINVRQVRLLTTLGYSVAPSAWIESGQVKPHYTNSKGIPARTINNCIYKIQIHFSEYEAALKTRPTHAARRTFICFALSQGIPPQVVMKWTGHSDYKAMRPYIDIAEKTKADAMKIIDIADLLIRWRQSGRTSGNSADSTANPVFLQIQKYISLKHHDSVLALIEELEMEVVGVGRMTVHSSI